MLASPSDQICLNLPSSGTLDRTRSVDLRQQAVYVANLFYITSDAIASVVEDKQLSEEASKNYNLILIGGPKENSWSNHFLDKVPLRTTERGMFILILYFIKCSGHYW